MPLRPSSRKMGKRITFTTSIRALSVAIVVVAAVFGFLIFGAYQGIQANHNGLQANKTTQAQGRTQRVADDTAIKAQINASFCDVVYFFDGLGVKSAPFLEHIRKEYKCEPASAHPSPKGAKPITASTLPAAQAEGGGAGGTKTTQGHSGPGGAPTSTPGPTRTPKPKPAPSPVITIPPLLSPVCKLLDPILGTCILLP